VEETQSNRPNDFLTDGKDRNEGAPGELQISVVLLFGRPIFLGRFGQLDEEWRFGKLQANRWVMKQ
jgi:hypothetical protein